MLLRRPWIHIFPETLGYDCCGTWLHSFSLSCITWNIKWKRRARTWVDTDFRADGFNSHWDCKKQTECRGLHVSFHNPKDAGSLIAEALEVVYGRTTGYSMVTSRMRSWSVCGRVCYEELLQICIARSYNQCRLWNDGGNKGIPGRNGLKLFNSYLALLIVICSAVTNQANRRKSRTLYSSPNAICYTNPGSETKQDILADDYLDLKP